MSKEMEGGNRERRKKAKEARDEGRKASEDAATLGSSKQRSVPDKNSTHREKIEHQRRGKQPNLTENTPEARPRNRDRVSDD